MTMVDERYEFSAKAKRNLGILLVVGIVLLVVGVISNMGDAGHDDHHALNTVSEQLIASTDAVAAGDNDEAHHETATWLKRLYANLWINNVFFAGLAIIGLFFVAVQYAAQAGWSVPVLRVSLSMGNWLPIAGVLMFVVFMLGKHDLFHWTHEYLYDKTSTQYDAIIAGKRGFLNVPFFLIRMVVFFGAWYLFFISIRKHILAEDLEGGVERWKRTRVLSAWFLVFFAVSSSMSAWDWVMSIDTHWFSTMFGWYMFASSWVSGLALLTLLVIMLKRKGLLSIVNADHLHDLGKFVWAFSIFWSYIWFSQFMLIYYANIPEETIYFVERLSSEQYKPIFFINLIVNFVLPFLLLMTHSSKRQMSLLQIVCVIVLVGHWFDFYLMITPGTMKEHGGFGFMEIGIACIYVAMFMWVTLSSLSKHPLIAKNHPMLAESMHHHV